MKKLSIQLCIMLVVFLMIWFFSPLITAGIAKWPEWLRNSNVQFILTLLISIILAFNPWTASFISNKAVIKGNNNQVIQGAKAARSDSSVSNTARITGNQNEVEQG